MQLDSAREVKERAFKAIDELLLSMPSAASQPEGWREFAARHDAGEIAVRQLRLTPPRLRDMPLLSMGIAPGRGAQDYRLAVRIRRENALAMAALRKIRDLARGEVDERTIGSIGAAPAPLGACPPYGGRIRPLVCGSSVAHYRSTAGSVGGFLRRADEADSVFLLSNNHVIARENRCKASDPTLQPGPSDGGTLPKDQVAALTKWERLRTANTVDCAMAKLDLGVEYEPRDLGNGRRLAGLGPPVDQRGATVHKVGRKTGPTSGRVTAFEVRSLPIQYAISGMLLFDDQIEIEGANTLPFAARGDSGALVFDGDCLALGLFFAQSSTGGSNGQGLSYANPIQSVVDALGAQLIC